MDKVKLPRNVSVAIDCLSARWGRKAFLQADFLRNSQHPEAKIINEYFKPFCSDDSDGFDKLFFALYYGHEVEETPEDKVREFFNAFSNPTEEGMYKRNAIIKTLDLLNIKIEGVNHE